MFTTCPKLFFHIRVRLPLKASNDSTYFSCMCLSSSGISIFSSLSFGQNCSLRTRDFSVCEFTSNSSMDLTSFLANCSRMLALIRRDSAMSLSMASHENKLPSPNRSFSSSRFRISVSILFTPPLLPVPIVA